MSNNHVAFGPTLVESLAPAPPGTAAGPALSGGAPGRFEPIRLLGRGGIGEVTLVRDTAIGRTVAVKRLRADVASADHVARFVDEVRTVGTLAHPNIGAIHDAGVDANGRHFFVMPYVDGTTLETIIGKLAAGDAEYHRRYTFEVRVQIMLGVLHAVHYAHAKGIIHRDIKPANIMIGPFGEVVMMDWGIARRLGGADHAADEADAPAQTEHDRVFRTRHGTLIGTPAYMAPEQACGDRDAIDERTDTYALAVVFYELLTLQHYLPGHATMSEMLAAVIAKPHLHPAAVASPHQAQVPAELCWFVENGLAKDPGRRYQTTGAMLDALLRAMSGSFHAQCFVTWMKRGGESTLRLVDAHPRAAFASGLAVAASALLGLVSLATWLAAI